MELIDLVHRHDQDPATQTEAVNRVLGRVAAYELSTVLHLAANSTPLGDTTAVAWLVGALRSTKDKSEILSIRALARRHRSAAPQDWDAAWRRVSGSVPRWLKAEQIYAEPWYVRCMSPFRGGPREWPRTWWFYRMTYRERWRSGYRKPWW